MTNFHKISVTLRVMKCMFKRRKKRSSNTLEEKQRVQDVYTKGLRDDSYFEVLLKRHPK